MELVRCLVVACKGTLSFSRNSGGSRTVAAWQLSLLLESAAVDGAVCMPHRHPPMPARAVAAAVRHVFRARLRRRRRTTNGRMNGRTNVRTE